jgi:hypothetical protein
VSSELGYDLTSTTWTFVTPTRTLRTTKFQNEFALLGDRFIEILNAAKRPSAFSAGSTVMNKIHAVRKLTRAIATYCPTSADIEEWGDALSTLLATESTSQRTKWGCASVANAILREIARYRGVHVVLTQQFSRKKATVADEDTLNDNNVKALVGHAKRDALAILNAFRNPPAEHISFIDDAKRIAGNNNGLFPKRADDKEAYAITRKWIQATGLSSERLISYVHPLVDDLVPFLILLCYGLAGNPDSVALMRRDAMRTIEHPAYGECHELQLEKPRAGSILPYLIRDKTTLSTYWIVKSVLELTEHVAPLATVTNRNLAFLAFALNSRQPTPILEGFRANAIHRYMDRYSIPRITLVAIRKHRGLMDLEANGDPFRVKRLLNQSDFAITAQYLEQRDALTDEISIADVQAEILKEKRSEVAAVPDDEIRTSSHLCLHPTNSEHGTDRYGFCESLLWPFNDRHFVFDFTPRSVAFLLRDYNALCEAQKRLTASRFKRKFYDVKMRIIETDILPMISDELRSAALKLVAVLPTIGHLD